MSNDYEATKPSGATCSFHECSYNPSPLSEIPFLLAGSALLLVGIFYRIRGVWMEDSEIVLTLAMTAGVVGVGLLLLVAWKCLNQRLCFCETYVSRYAGILSTNLRTSRLLYKHVRGVEIEQSILGRILNIGDIHVGSDNSRSTAEIVLRGVRNPERIKDMLLQRVDAANELSLDEGSDRRYVGNVVGAELR